MQSRSDRQRECHHHWVIDPVGGPTSQGRCKLCGTRKTFFNVYEDVVADLEARRLEELAATTR